MIVNLSQLLKKADQGNYAVIAPDFISLAEARLIVNLAEEIQTPMILSYAPIFRPLMDVSNFGDFISLIRGEIEKVETPICLHLDHAATLEEIGEAIEAGFTSVMIDASTEAWEINVGKTCRTVEIASGAGVSVEAELGHVAAGTGYFLESESEEVLTDPTKAAEFVKVTGIDALAVAIGNRHGLSRGEPMIDFKRLNELKHSVDVPLVLHGASGIGMDPLMKAVRSGIRKINVFSEITQAAHTGMLAALQTDLSDPFAVASAKEEGIREVLIRFVQLSGSAGRAHNLAGNKT